MRARDRIPLVFALVVLAATHACGLVASDPSSAGGSGGAAASAGGAAASGVDASSPDAMDASGGASDANPGTPDGSSADGAWDATDAPEDAPFDAGAAPPCPAPGVAPSEAAARPSCAQAPVCACGLSCCDSRLVPGGWFPMGRSLNGSDSASVYVAEDYELPEHQAKVSDFRLDTFEVTVARFREFADQYPASLPAPDAGAHPEVPESGWQADWTAFMPASRAELEAGLDCNGTYLPYQYPTWTSAPGPYESHPLNCVNWYVAFAFCAWDGGRLPTEAEWEYASAGGDENRRFPWGNYRPWETSWDWAQEHACMVSSTCLGNTPTTWGLSRWGQFSMAGSVWEWVLDDPSTYPAEPCSSCTTYQPNAVHAMMKGGAWICWAKVPEGWGGFEGCIRAAARGGPGARTAAGAARGFRCARSP